PQWLGRRTDPPQPGPPRRHGRTQPVQRCRVDEIDRDGAFRREFPKPTLEPSRPTCSSLILRDWHETDTKVVPADLAPPLRNRWFADSPQERRGIEPSVPGAGSVTKAQPCSS